MNDPTLEWLAIISSGVVGVAGLVAAALANRRAKQSNEIAERANQLAADALGKAAEANQIAENANALSGEANTIARTQAAQQADPSHVEWRAHWDEEALAVVLTNTGRDLADDVFVIVRGRQIGELVETDGPVGRSGEVLVPFPEVPEQRVEHERSEAAWRAEVRREGLLILHRPIGSTYTFEIHWRSEFGKPCEQTLKLHVR